MPGTMVACVEIDTASHDASVFVETRSVCDGWRARSLFLPNSDPLGLGSDFFRRNEFRRGVGGGATAAVVQHHLGEVAAGDITAIEVARTQWAAGRAASPKISHQIFALAAAGPFNPEEPNEVAVDTQGAGIDHLWHADKRNGCPRRNVVPRLRGTWRGGARGSVGARPVGVAATDALLSEAASSVFVNRPAMNASITRATAAETAANAYRGRTEGSPDFRLASESGACG